MSDITDPLDIIANPPVMTVVEKPWGTEWCIQLGPYLVKVIEVEDGHATSLQYHEHKREVQYVLQHGQDPAGLIAGAEPWDGDSTLLQLQPKETAIPIDCRVLHRTIGPELHLEISTNHPTDVVRLEDRYTR